MRSVLDMIAGANAPQECQSLGRLLADLDSHQCRFPLRGTHERTRFCAVEVPTGDWQPGKSGGSYCRFHRMLSIGQGTPAERSAVRVLERATK